MQTKTQVLAGLNEHQKKAVLNYNGPSFIVACPGSGKTHTVISRTAYMIADGIDPYNIAIFTFTKKAAEELKERVAQRIGSSADSLTVGTYHSFCARLLRKYVHYLGYDPGFSIYDEDDKRAALKKIAPDDIKLDILASKISAWKNAGMFPGRAITVTADTGTAIEQRMAECYRDYQTFLKANNAVDFDDLILLTIKILSEYPEVREAIYNRYKYIMADEAQDSSDRDLELVRLLVNPKFDNVCFVGDDDQSIYAFRGANLSSVLNIKRYFPDIIIYTLNINYRSTKSIVEASRTLIANNKNQIKKVVYTNNVVGEKIHVFECKDSNDEASRVAKTITWLHDRLSIPYDEIAVLYRMSYLSRNMEEALLHRNIPYTIVNGCPFYARKEIKDIVSYLQFAVNPFDSVAFERIVNIPKRGIGDKTLQKILEFTKQESHDKIPLTTVCKTIKLKGGAKKGLESFVSVIEDIASKCHDLPPADILRYIVDTIKYYDYLRSCEDNYDERYGNVEELIKLAANFETIDEFLGAIKSEHDESSDNAASVKLLTMHSAKGLEFRVVFIIGAYEGCSPHYKASFQHEIEEERRLFYVAMTRAKELLFVTFPKRVVSFSGIDFPEASRFLNEIDNKYLLKIS